MRYLLYCIFRSPEHKKLETLVGVDGQPVFSVANDGLNAATSRIAHWNMKPDTSRIMTYEGIVESFHRNHTVIPMRYGSLFEEESQIIMLLEERGGQYESLLKDLEGCVEMGIRVLISECGANQMRIADCGLRNESKPSGRAYLECRRAYYAQEEKWITDATAILKSCCSAFDGLFVRYKEEYPRFRNPWPRPGITGLVAHNKLKHQGGQGRPHSAFRINLASLYFLVPRSSVKSFRDAFRKITFKESARLLLSGPWPPYNFVELQKRAHPP